MLLAHCLLVIAPELSWGFRTPKIGALVPSEPKAIQWLEGGKLNQTAFRTNYCPTLCKSADVPFRRALASPGPPHYPMILRGNHMAM